MREQYMSVLDRLLHPLPTWLPLADTHGFWLASLNQGADAVCGRWLQSGAYIHLSVVCCPNRWEAHPCPTTGKAAPEAIRW
ncbi:hypothetical protein DEF23_09840 [Marinitenerispora sediminis]|uniref:Uncharacterized protein n=1 Tax=Marinitenerispora sediminis TaxID=1931232 RepID=A0A368TBN8_9ACTN|nr:hypothetical protein DEF28_00975 [Marinitenerispora sediminis]RCV57901.1 hypothetical protein DEF23_09840 [Marinitenerispora sediminis]RCV60654.1 hypothetical protein DEF24_06570 [Marinitenerispora sediminis]